MAGRTITTLSGSCALAPGGEAPATLTIEDGRITRVEPGGDSSGRELIVPGFVDLQVNGMDDVDCSTAGADDWNRADQLLAATGVTAWLPTLVSRDLARYDRPLASIEEASRRPGSRPAVLGAHLEGPFLGDRLGAHRPDAVVRLDIHWLQDLPSTVRMVTIAPEQHDVVAAIGQLTRRGMVVGLGHSDADFQTTSAAIDAGARMVTHLFNAMGPMHHRRPGMVGAALSDGRVVAGLIADLVHVHPAVVRTAFRAKGAERIALVTDAVGWRAQHLVAADLAVVDGAPRLPDGTLAGSSLTMDQAVRNVVDAAGISPVDAIRSASTTPAQVLGDGTRGRIAPGARADLVVLDTDDLSVRRTMVGGVTVWES